MRCPVAIAHLVVPVTAPCEVAICIAIVSKIAGKTSRSGHVAKNLVASWCWYHHGGVLLILGVNPVDWATIFRSVPEMGMKPYSVSDKVAPTARSRCRAWAILTRSLPDVESQSPKVESKCIVEHVVEEQTVLTPLEEKPASSI